ncbi:hypothetical protein IT157_07225 [bacterium]|nr:hypothetical protein [bacterium]
MKLLLLALALVAFAGSAECGLTPRLFVEASASPFDPTHDYLIRAGLMSAKRQVFIGYYNTSDSPTVDEDGVYWTGNRQFIAGVRWMTTSNPLVVVVPAIGGGLSVGKAMREVWWENEYGHPEGGFYHAMDANLDVIGGFADVGLLFRIRPTPLMITANAHLDMCFNERTTTYNGVKQREVNGFGTGAILLGASYRF